MSITYDAIEDNLPDSLNFKEDRDWDAWPKIGFELDISWASAEPDVGIMSDYVDDYSFDGWVGDAKFNDEVAFAKAVYAAISDDVEASEAEIAEMLKAWTERELESVQRD